MMEIKKIAVLGAGQMGNGIAHVCAQAGYEVVMRDIDQKFIDKHCAFATGPSDIGYGLPADHPKE